MMVVMRMTMIMVLLMLMWVVSVRTIYDCQDCDAYRSQDSYSVYSSVMLSLPLSGQLSAAVSLRWASLVQL